MPLLKLYEKRNMMRLWKKFSLMISCLLMVSGAFSQTVLGKWKMVDDENGKERSIVLIYEKDGLVYGKIIELLNPKKKNAVCKKCEDYRKDQKIEGMVVMDGLKKEGNEYSGGQILNPDSGKLYRCKIWLDDHNPDKLHVRGYLAFFYRTQTWVRAE